MISRRRHIWYCRMRRRFNRRVGIINGAEEGDE
jgi:hypothetical protein